MPQKTTLTKVPDYSVEKSFSEEPMAPSSRSLPKCFIPCKSVDVDNFNSPLTLRWLDLHTAPIDGEDETGAHPYQAAALGRYLHGLSSVGDTILAMTSLAPEASDTPSGLRDRVFGIIEDALFELPQVYTPALVDLLRSFDIVPGADETGNPIWNGIKSFGHSWSDSWRQSHWREALKTRDPRTRDTRRAAHVHHAFVEATCATAGTGINSQAPDSAEGGVLPLSWGYDCLSDALEQQESVIWDFEVPAAAIWIRVAGRRIVEGATSNETSWALEREGRLWPPGPMSINRWQFWLNRLDGAKTFGGETRRAVEDALACAKDMALVE